MKKRFLSVLLCLCMVMTLLPVTAWAGSSYSVCVDNNALWSGSISGVSITEASACTAYYFNNGTIQKNPDSEPEGWNIKLSHEASSDIVTLEFNNLQIDGHQLECYLPGSTLNIILYGENSITGSNGSSYRRAIYIDNDNLVTISGPGSLTLTSPRASALEILSADLEITDGASLFTFGLMGSNSGDFTKNQYNC